MAGESKLQSKCIKYAKANKVVMRKIHAESCRGWMDTVLIFQGGETVWVEFKNPVRKCQLSTLQILEHALAKRQGATVYTCASFENFEIIIKRHLK